MKPRYLFTLAVLAIAGAAVLCWMGATAAQASAPGVVQRHSDGTLSLSQTVDLGPGTALGPRQAMAVPAPPQASSLETLVSPLATVTILSEGFEAPTAWPVPGSPWSVFDGDGVVNGEYFWDKSKYRAHSGEWGAWCARGGADGVDPFVDPIYRPDMRSWAVYGPFDLADATDASLNFYLNLHTQRDHDYFWWLASVDSLRFYGYAQSGNPYADQWSSVQSLNFKNVPFLGNLLGRSQVWIAFLFTSDSDTPLSRGAFIDDITIRKTTGAASFDLVADRVYLGDDQGNEILSPSVGQQVYFWLDWHVDGVGTTPTSFVVECRLDDVVFDYYVRNAVGGESYSTRFGEGPAEDPWTVEAGEHVVLCRLDPQDPPPGEAGNVLAELSEANNDASLTVNRSSRAWTYMVYLDGDTDIAGRADQALYALEEAAANTDVNIVVLFDGDADDDTVIYKAERDRVYQFGTNIWRAGTYGSPYGAPGEANMGHPDTLSNFVNWARGTFPADNYALCIWDHAYNPDPAMPHLVRGICWDHAAGGDYLTMTELSAALGAIAGGTGLLDLLHLSTDLMGMSEVVYQVEASLMSALVVRYVVASENPVGTPEPYAAYLSGVTGLTTARDLAETMVDQYHLAMGALGHTMAAYDLMAGADWEIALDDLAVSLTTGLAGLRGTFETAIGSAWAATQKLDSDGNGVCSSSDVYVDLGDLAAKLVSALTGADPLVVDARAKAQALATALAVGPSNFIFAEAHGSGPSPTGGTYNLVGAKGMAIYFPASPESPGWLPYNNLDGAPANLVMVATTNWDEFLRAYFDVFAAPSDFGHSDQTADSITWTWVDNSFNEDGFRIYDEGDILRTTAGPNETSAIETGLAPNTQYTRYVVAYKGVDETDPSNLASAYTLPVAPDVSADLPPPGPYPAGTTFTFTNAAGFGPGSLDHHRYVWDTNATHTWDDTEDPWDTGTLPLTASSDGNWYLHLNSYNPVGESGGTLDYGPFVVGDLSAPSDFSALDKAADSITWTWVDNSSIEDGFRIYDEGDVLMATAAADETSVVETGLAPNTQYTRYAVAYHLAAGESAPSNQAVVYTLPAYPDVSADLPPPGPHPVNTIFTITNVAGFGPGGVDHYRFVWDTQGIHTWTDTEDLWDSGTLQVDAPWVGDWYLHVKSYNAVGESGGILDYGPFTIDALAAPSDFGYSDKTTDSITWTWTDNSPDEDGFRIYDEGDVLQTTAGADETSVVEGGLAPNTQYTRYVVAYNAVLGESDPSNQATVYTLPVAPDVSADPSPPGPYPAGTGFTFTNLAGFGAGSLEYYRYVWDTNPTHTWTDTEDVWGAGTLDVTAPYMGSWYLHVNSYNATDESGGTADYGPFVIVQRFDCLGWNLVALPFEPASLDPWEVFDELRPPSKPMDLLSGSLYRYDPGLQSYIAYQQSDPAAFGDLNTHDGYWLFLADTLDLYYDYLAPPSSPTPDSRLLPPGWNLIGAGSPSAVPLADALFSRGGGDPVTFEQAVANGWVEPVTYAFDCPLGSYAAIGLPDGIWQPWQGFWFNVLQTDVTMTVNIVAP